MTKTKNTKRALLSSALALLVCVSMLIGSTFAWFTDSASTGSNIIKSGNLDVVLQMKDEAGEWVSAEGQTLEWITEDDVDNVLWEPGCTYKLPELRIKNVGNLALKYEVQITGFEGDRELLDVIDFTGIPEQDVTEALLPEASVEFTIEGHMQESAGNTYMNKTLSGISITVVATQYTYEKDSYSDQYDAAAGTAFVGGNGTKENPYLVDEASQLLSISDYYDSGFTYFKVADGVETLDLTGVGRIKLNGSFDGNGVEITGLTTALFEFVGKPNDPQEIKISNFTATVNTTDGRALVKNINNPNTTTFENVELHGYIEGQSNMGSFYNYGTANNGGINDGANYTVNFVNAKSDVTLVCTAAQAIGGMLGHGYQGSGYTVFINMDENSGYTGKMYSTGTATCYEIMALCSDSTYVLNGEVVSRKDRTYPSTKLAVATPTAEADGYYVAPASGVDHYVVTVNSQLTAYDENGVKIPNKAGLTWVLGTETITEGFEGKVFDIIESGVIVNDENVAMGYEVSNGVLTVNTGRKQNFASGWITLNVTQYDANGTILATGNLRVYDFAEP